MTRALTAGALGALLAACPPTPPATGDSGVDAGSCEGTIGCACANGACTTGECVGGTCTDCRRGEASCICRSNGTCNAGLRCTNNSCVTCPPGELNCACNAGDTCNTGLACAAGTCVQNNCVAGTPNCPCRAGDPKCDDTNYCDGTNVCRTCSEDVVGCPCNIAGLCTGQAVCDSTSMRCRAPRTCADLVAANQCGQNQACTETNGADAVCQPMTCKPQFKWDGTQCIACVSLDCAAEPSCTADGGLSTTCAAQNRTCVQTGAVATCGPCVAGYTQNASNQCVTVPTCGSVTCTIDQYCDRTGGSATCVALPCPAGQARGATGVCTPCTNPVPNCSGAGFSSRVWPFRTAGNEACICETLDNYYLPPGNAQSAVLCDADNDGWVREEAGDVSVTGDPALSANARCNILRPTRVRLFDEYGISVDVLSCTEGLLKASLALADGGVPNGGFGMLADGGLLPLADGGAACSGLVPLRLLEKQINDIPGRPMGTTAPAYGGITNGRLLEAAELNTLTKACATETADYNANGVEDINEKQTIVNTPNDRQRLESFSFFLELHTAYFENDALVIKERSRCSADFPVRYDPDAGVANPVDLYDFNSDTPYWRTCSRNRDPEYDQADLQPSMDFAHWSCSDPSNTCTPVQLPHAQIIAPPDWTVVLMRNHGLCELQGALPADGRWRGMTHHSQFKCVSVQNSPAPPTGFVTTDFSSANDKLTLNTCLARPCTTPGDPACTTVQGTGRQTRRPVIECRAKAAASVGDVGFAAVNYRPYRASDSAYPGATYRGGCINEDDLAFTYLCRSPEFSLDIDAGVQNFGRYSCYGRGSNFLWCGTNCNPARNTLRWGPNNNSSVLR